MNQEEWIEFWGTDSKWDMYGMPKPKQLKPRGMTQDGVFWVGPYDILATKTQTWVWSAVPDYVVSITGEIMKKSEMCDETDTEMRINDQRLDETEYKAKWAIYSKITNQWYYKSNFDLEPSAKIQQPDFVPTILEVATHEWVKKSTKTKTLAERLKRCQESSRSARASQIPTPAMPETELCGRIRDLQIYENQESDTDPESIIFDDNSRFTDPASFMGYVWH